MPSRACNSHLITSSINWADGFARGKVRKAPKPKEGKEKNTH